MLEDVPLLLEAIHPDITEQKVAILICTARTMQAPGQFPACAVDLQLSGSFCTAATEKPSRDLKLLE